MKEPLLASAPPRHPIPGVAYRDTASVDRLARSGFWSLSTVGDAVREAAHSSPNAEAVVSSTDRMTWSEVDQRSDRLAAGLFELGLQPGDKVLVQIGIEPATVLVLAALFKAGIVPVCAVPQYRDFEMGPLCARSGAVAHLIQPTSELISLSQRLRSTNSQLRQTVTVSGPPVADTVSLSEVERLAPTQAIEPLRAAAPSSTDVMSFQLSGGTTGVPKIIPRFHGEYLAYAGAFGLRIGLTRSDRYLWSLPLSHNAGMILMLVPCILNRSTMVLLERFQPEPFLSLIAAERVTVTGSIGPIAPRLLALPDLDRYDLTSVRYFFALNRAADLEARLKVPAGNVFGITEGMLMASHPADPIERRHGTVGSPVSLGDRVVVVDPGTDRPIKPGEPGELCFTGPSMLTAYFKDPDATAKAFTEDGFFHTGDLAAEHTVNGVRCYSFEGRIKDNIDRGGEKFGTEELEVLLSTHPAIVGSAVVGMPDPMLGERVCAFLIARPGAPIPTVEEVARFLLDRGVAKFKLPERIEVVREFPTTSVGKLDRAALRSSISRALDGAPSSDDR